MSEPSSDSESCPSFQTESESEHESNWDEEKERKEVDYTATAKEIICENVNITTGNALRLNSGYHNMLKVLKNKLEILLGQCQERQVEIEKQIEEYKNNRKPLVGRSRTSGYICGQPYFKDEDLYPGPHNDDYLRRKNVLGEFFPLDLFESTDTNWTVKDKMNILRGVKRQIVEFVEREIRLKIKKLGNGLEAERLRLEMESLQRREVHDLWERVKQFSNDYPGVRFKIDWLRVSNVDIGGRHSAAACMGLWNNYMLPGLVRDAWKTEEESILLDVVEKYGRQDWIQIAAEVPGRSAYQCFVHYQTTFSELAQIKREPWNSEEDALLIKAVDDNRIGSNIIWNKVVERMPLRNKIQCYNRYMFTLMRPMKNAKFTPEEDCVILAYVQQCGDDFRFIPPSLLPGRTNRQIWARYNHTLKYVNKHAGWTIEEDMRLMNFIKENLTDEGPRKISWAACSKALGNHSRLSCRTRYYTIEKFLEKNPDATLDDVPRKEKKLSSTVTNENWMKTFIDIRNDSKETNPEDAPTEQEQPSTSNNAKPIKRSRPQRKLITESKARPFIDTIKCQIKRKFYHKLKYSFHYRFGDQMPEIQNSKVFCMNRAIFHLMNCTTNLDHPSVSLDCFTPNEMIVLRSSIPIRFNPSLVNFLEDAKSCFLFPPSYNTMLGMRGITLNVAFAADSKGDNVEETTRSHEEDEPGYRHALDTFRDRFRMIFHWTMLLAQENPGQVTFLDADEQPKPEYRLHKSFGVEQIALDQLAELCGNSVPMKIPPEPTIEETITGMEQMELASPIKAESDIHRPCLPAGPQVQIIAVKRLTETSAEPIQIDQFNDPPQPVQIVTQPAAAPYHLTYPLAPNPLFQGTTMVHGRPDKLPSFTPGQFVGQITIINPQDLPAVQMPTMAVPVVDIHPLSDGLYQHQQQQQQDELSELTRTENDGHDQEKKPVDRVEPSRQLEVSKDGSPSDQNDSKDHTSEPIVQNEAAEATATLATISEEQLVVELLDDNDAIQTTISASHVSNFECDFDAAIPANVVVPQHAQLEPRNIEPTLDPAPPVSEDNRSEPMDTSATTMDSSGGHIRLDSSTDQRTTDSAPEDHSSSSSMSGWSDGGKSSRDDDLYEDLTNPTHQVTNVTNVGEFVIQELQDPEPEPDCTRSMDIENLNNAVGRMPEEAFTELRSQLLDDPEWDPERFNTPKRTYGRTKKPTVSRISDQSSRPQVSDSHAWRWVHVDEFDEHDVELHQSLWENCNPFRIQFSADDLNNSTETVVAEPKKDDIIVIDDDEINIKEEPVDITESQTESTIDQALQIQQIIETASNILRISEEFQAISSQDTNDAHGTSESVLTPEAHSKGPTEDCLVQTPAKDFDAVPPTEVIPYTNTDSLVVQTPSRVFDEQANCYYFVDEIQDATSLLVPAQTSVHLPTTYWIYDGGEDNAEAGPSKMNSPPPETTQQPVSVTIQDPQSPSNFQHTLDKIRTYAYKTKAQPTKQPSAAESSTNSEKKHWKPQSKSHRTESILQSTEVRIRKPKRPPREATKISPHQQHAVQTQALSLLDALFKKPKARRICTTSRMSPVAKYPRPTEAPKRPTSSSQYSSTAAQQPAKKIKLEPLEPFDAVDVISLLANDQNHQSKCDDVDEEESEYLAQLTMPDAPQRSSGPMPNNASATPKRI